MLFTDGVDLLQGPNWQEGQEYTAQDDWDALALCVTDVLDPNRLGLTLAKKERAIADLLSRADIPQKFRQHFAVSRKRASTAAGRNPLLS